MSDSCGPSKPGTYPSDCEITAGLRDIAAGKKQAIKRKDRNFALSKAKEIKLLLLDVDGVLTDNSLIYLQDGNEAKMFNTQDGFGLRLIRESGIDTGVITARKSEIVARRANELGMRFVHQGCSNKLEAYKEILQQSSRKPFEVAYMGDDWLDMVLLKRVGFSCAPANSVEEVMEMVHYVTSRSGGHGAVREICNLLLEAQGLYPKKLKEYMDR